MDQHDGIKRMKLAGELYMNLKRSETAYREYLQGGKSYQFARVLKIYNRKIRKLLLKKGWLLPGHLEADALLLISHYDIWLQKWNDLEKRLTPEPGDEFIFPNDSVFPKEAAKNIEAEYLRAKESIADAG